MLYKGLSKRPFILLILSLTRLLLGCINQGVFLKHCFHLSLSFSWLLHHTLWHDDTSSGKHSEGLENQAWVRSQRAQAGRRKRGGWSGEGGDWQGKQKGSLKLQVLRMEKIKIGTENVKGSVTNTEGCSDRTTQSFHWLQCLLSTREVWLEEGRPAYLRYSCCNRLSTFLSSSRVRSWCQLGL